MTIKRGNRKRLTPPLERFEAKVVHDGVSTCWHWGGSVNPKYGSFAVNATKEAPKRVLAHRFAYEAYVGPPIPAGLEIDHICRNTLCVNPAHLRACTHQENIDAVPREVYRRPKAKYTKGRKLVCKRGHDMIVHSKPVKNGHECRACRKISDKVWRYKRRAIRVAA